MTQLIALAPLGLVLVVIYLLWRIKKLLAAIFATLQFVVEMYVDSLESSLAGPGKKRTAAVDRLKLRHDELASELERKRGLNK